MSFLRYSLLCFSLTMSQFSMANSIEDAVESFNQQIVKTSRLINLAGIERIELLESRLVEVENAKPFYFGTDLAESTSIWKKQSLSTGVWWRTDNQSLVELFYKEVGDIELQDFSSENVDSIPSDRDYGRDNENLFFLDRARSEIYRWNGDSQRWDLDRSQIELPTERFHRFFGANGHYYIVTNYPDRLGNKVWRLEDTPVLIEEMEEDLIEVYLSNNRVTLTKGIFEENSPGFWAEVKFLGEKLVIDKWHHYGTFINLNKNYWIRSIPLSQREPFEYRQLQVTGLRNGKKYEVMFPSVYESISCYRQFETVSCSASTEDYIVEFRLVNDIWEAIAMLNLDELSLPEDYYTLFAYGGGFVIRYEKDNRIYYEAVTNTERVILFEADFLERTDENSLPKIGWGGVKEISNEEVVFGFSISGKSFMLKLKLNEETGLHDSISLTEFPEYQIESTADQKELDIDRTGIGSGPVQAFLLLVLCLLLSIKGYPIAESASHE